LEPERVRRLGGLAKMRSVLTWIGLGLIGACFVGNTFACGSSNDNGNGSGGKGGTVIGSGGSTGGSSGASGSGGGVGFGGSNGIGGSGGASGSGGAGWGDHAARACACCG